MSEYISVGDFDVQVIKKDIKNIHLSVNPPTGMVRVSAPKSADTETIKAFALTKLDWIKRHHEKLSTQARESQRELINGESLFVWGKRYLVNLEVRANGEQVKLIGKKLLLRVSKDDDRTKREVNLDRWYREELRRQANHFISDWQDKLGVTVNRLFIQRMKRKWGSCNPTSNSIRLKTDLIHKPTEATEFVVVHELAHLIEPKHSAEFYQLMDDLMPTWRSTRQKLNEAPLSYVTWANLRG